jgi:hypothetical protein
VVKRIVVKEIVVKRMVVGRMVVGRMVVGRMVVKGIVVKRIVVKKIVVMRMVVKGIDCMILWDQLVLVYCPFFSSFSLFTLLRSLSTVHSPLWIHFMNTL